MESKKIKQLVKGLNEKLESWNWEKALDSSQNETTTRGF